MARIGPYLRPSVQTVYPPETKKGSELLRRSALLFHARYILKPGLFVDSPVHAFKVGCIHIVLIGSLILSISFDKGLPTPKAGLLRQSRCKECTGSASTRPKEARGLGVARKVCGVPGDTIRVQSSHQPFRRQFPKKCFDDKQPKIAKPSAS